MAWNQERAALRIQRFKETVPQGEIVVEDFARYLGERRVLKASGGLTDDKLAILRVPRNRAITTHGAHIYANLIDFNGVLEDAGVETEASHRRALEFLHTHYSACDSLIDEFEIQRVDFHGSRLHAVVLTPEGRENEPERIRKAISFAAAFRQMVERLGNDFPEFQTAVRVGIDSGPAVAIDSGKRDEPDPFSSVALQTMRPSSLTETKKASFSAIVCSTRETRTRQLPSPLWQRPWKQDFCKRASVPEVRHSMPTRVWRKPILILKLR